jgi:hypothetical protein
VLCVSVCRCLAAFEKGARPRVLHTVAPVIRKHLVVDTDADTWLVFGDVTQEEIREPLLELDEAMLGRARLAIACWSVVGLRCGLVKDVRMLIAKTVWEEPWRWGRPDAQL